MPADQSISPLLAPHPSSHPWFSPPQPRLVQPPSVSRSASVLWLAVVIIKSYAFPLRYRGVSLHHPLSPSRCCSIPQFY